MSREELAKIIWRWFGDGSDLTDPANGVPFEHCLGCVDEVLAAQQDGAWQPIETAPKDTPVNIFVPVNRPERRVLSAYQDDAGWTILSGSIVIGKPTHWRPLPAGPEQKAPTSIMMKD